MDEIDFEKDGFQDILAKDRRYDARAYALLSDVVGYLGEQQGHMTSADVMDEFRETALDHFGPLAFQVLSEWGVHRTEDIGEMMFNLVDSKRIARDDGDSIGEFGDGYDFIEAFVDPYEP